MSLNEGHGPTDDDQLYSTTWDRLAKLLKDDCVNTDDERQVFTDDMDDLVTNYMALVKRFAAREVV